MAHSLFSHFFIDTTEEKISRAIIYNGNYNNGKKHGAWHFNSKKLQPGSRFEEKNYEIIYRTNGIEFSVKGNFIEGEPEGQWEMLRQNIYNSSPIDTLLFVKANFSKGKMQGAVEGRQLNILFSGRVSDEGFLDSSWVFRHFSPSGNPVTEYRIFDYGILKAHFFVEDEDTVTLRYSGLDDAADRKENWENLNIDTRYFNILKNANVQSDVPHELFTDKSNSILENASIAFSRFDGEPVWDKLGGSVSPNPAQVRMRKFPFTVEEELAMREAGEKLKIITGKLDTFFYSPDIELERHAEKTMMFYYEVMKVYQSKAGKLRQLVKQFSIPAFEYINHDEIFDYIMPDDMTYPEKIEYEFKSEIFEEEYFSPNAFKKITATSISRCAILKLF